MKLNRNEIIALMEKSNCFEESNLNILRGEAFTVLLILYTIMTIFQVCLKFPKT